MSTRVLIIGLDGLTFDVINPLLDAGRLPNLARLRTEGVAAPLRSTYPDTSAPAWTSCRTGVNPGKHGLFSFWRIVDYEWVFMSSADLHVPAVEHILSRQGRRVCSVNVPITYPPQPVNGVVISGLPTPGPDSNFTYPAGLRDELLARVGGCPVDGFGDLDYRNPSELVHQLYERHRRRREVSRFLLGRESWDYFMAVFTVSDKIQHGFWRARERWLHGDTNPLVQRFGPVIDQCYELLDETVGVLLAEAGDEATVLVVSDHGFGPCENEVYPNVWLRDSGHFKLRFAHKIWARQLRWEQRNGWPLPVPRVRVGPPRRRVDWRRTRAFGSLYVESRAIRLNMKGREPQGIVTSGQEAETLLQILADGFLDLKMPDGRPLFVRVYRPEEIYHGPYAREAADLVLKANDPSTRILGKFTVDHMLHPLTEVRASSGNHRPVGILFARGPKVDARALLDTPHIMDIAPTVLWALGEPAPAYLDGRSLFG
jgi:predicted AlkP superfamily phosphohydrolase/phosphomutase